MSLQLRPYQSNILDSLRRGFASGRRSQILYAPTGAGKTEMAIELLRATKEKGNKAAMLLDRIVLCDQTSKRLEKYSIEHGVLQSGHWRFRPYENIQVCSAQTLEKRGAFPGLNLLIVDECFTGNTLVSTPSGSKKISLLRCGDTVYNSTGVGTVLRAMVKPTQELYEVVFEDGTSIECTGNHPIFTDRGWVKASELEVGRVSFSEKGMRVLWESIQSQAGGRKWQDGDAHEQGKMGEAHRLLNILLQEVGKSDEQPSDSLEDAGATARNQTQANQEGWQWTVVAAAATCFASCVGGGLGVGILSSYKDEELGAWLSNALQDRHSKSGKVDCDRAGRWLARFTSAQRTRLEKDRISCFPRVVGISRVKCDRIEPVFNLHISGHPSYFANGKLVHNCHQTREQTVEFIKNNPDVKVIGLTATPFTKGLGNIYEGVVSSVTTKELVNQGVLVPLRVFISKEIDMTGAKKVAGEWSQAETTKRGMQITGDVVAEWIKMTHEIFGRPRKTIVFCAGVDHGNDLSRKFAEAGYNFVSISYRDDDEFKKDVIAEFAKPDTEIHGLIATDILTKGFDCVLEGSKILTDRGLVAVDKLLSSDKIWDGVEFVSHGGAIYKGFRDVITYEGLTATADHKVKTAQGWLEFGECAKRGIPIVKTGMGGQIIQEYEGCFSRNLFGEQENKQTANEMSMPGVWKNRAGACFNVVRASMGWLFKLCGSRLAGEAMQKSASKMHRPFASLISRLWWPWNSIQFCEPACGIPMDQGKHWDSRKHFNQYSFGSNQQRWPLRTWQHSLVDAARKQFSYTAKQVCGALSFFSCKPSRNQVFRQNIKEFNGLRADGCSNNREIPSPIRQTKGHVWDILNAGPRNRFTCEGLLIHNCQDVMIGVSARPFSKSLSSHIQQMGRVMRSNQDNPEDKPFALWLDHSGNYLRFREEWEEIYEQGVHELDDGKEKPKKEPTEKEKKEAKCPRCEAYMPRYLDTCTHCGFVREKRSLVQDVPGEMQELQTMSRENKQAWWSMLQWYVQAQGKSPGWAAHTFKDKFGVWPRNLSDRVEEPNAEVVKFVEKKKRAYIRSIKKGIKQ